MHIGISCGPHRALVERIPCPDVVRIREVRSWWPKSAYPVNGAEERYDDGTVAELDGLDEVQEGLRIRVVHMEVVQEGRARGPCGVEVPAQVYRREGCAQVRQRAGEAQKVRLFRDILELECFLDDVLAPGV